MQVSGGAYEPVQGLWRQQIRRERERGERRCANFTRWRSMARASARPSGADEAGEVADEAGEEAVGGGRGSSSTTVSSSTGGGGAAAAAATDGTETREREGAIGGGGREGAASGGASGGGGGGGGGCSGGGGAESLLVWSPRSVGGDVCGRRFVLAICPTWPSEVKARGPHGADARVHSVRSPSALSAHG